MPNYAERIINEANALAGAVRLANATTGAEDTEIVDAVATLIAGYGGGGGGKKLEIDYTLDADFTTTASTLLETLQTPEIQEFFDETVGQRGSFDTNKAYYFRLSMDSDVPQKVNEINRYEGIMVCNTPAASQFGNTIIVVEAHKNANGIVETSSQSSTYIIRPSPKNNSGNVWVIEMLIRAGTSNPTKVWRAGKYHFVFEFLYSTTDI